MKQSPAKLAVRQRLLRSPLAEAAAYRRFSSWLLQHRLQSFRDHFYHSPYFHLPPIASPAIATIHDLSIFRCLRFHIAERVFFLQREIGVTLTRANFLISDSEFIRPRSKL